MIRLFIVDDHALFRQGLIRLLDGDSRVQVVGSAESAQEALKQIASSQPDVLLLDYDLGGETALTLLQLLTQTGVRMRTLLVTAGVPDAVAMELMQMGISGIFPKQRPLEELYNSILDTADGKLVIDKDYFQNLVSSAKGRREKPVLSDRDRRVLRLLLEGLSNKEIAVDLHTSESAVKTAMQQLFAKTGVRTRSQLVRIALEQLRDEI